MGIPGLTSFLDANNHVLESRDLRDTKVVVDGNNLYHFLYTLYDVPVAFGGDYNVFYRCVTAFFSTLLKCNITPIVVFDGPYDPKDRKVQTAIKRAKDRIQLTHIAINGYVSRVTPISAHSVYIDALNDLGIDHVTCDSEADSEVAALANALNCPVLTNDSDFFIFNITAGVLLLDYVNVQLHTDKPGEAKDGRCANFIRVQLYKFPTFMKHFPGMSDDLFALFAIILGNEKTDSKLFEPFFTSVKLPSPKSDTMFSRRKNCRILSVLNWLENAQTLEVAMDKIVRFYKKDEKLKLQTLVTDSVNIYTNISVCNILPFLKDKWAKNVSAATNVPKTVLECSLPDWFLIEMHSSRLLPLTINIAVSQQAILIPQPEHLPLPSAHSISRKLRQVIYAIMVPREGPNYVNEFDRELKTQKRSKVEPQQQLENGLIVPNLWDVYDLDASDRLSIMCAALGVTKEWICLWPEDLQLYVAAVVYWLNNGEAQLDRLHLMAVMLCIIKLGTLDKLVSSGTEAADDSKSLPTTESSDGPENRLNISAGVSEILTSHCSSESIKKAQINLEKFSIAAPTPKTKALLGLDPLVIHTLSQLQSCVQAATCLNEALRTPLKPAKLSDVFNGSFLYSMYKELRSRLKPKEYVSEILGRQTVIPQVLQLIVDQVESTLVKGALKTDVESGRKRSKKSQAKMLAKQKKEQGSKKSEEDKKNDKKAKTTTMVAKCKLANKFGSLLLSDNDE